MPSAAPRTRRPRRGRSSTRRAARCAPRRSARPRRSSRRLAGGDRRLAAVRLALVAEHEPRRPRRGVSTCPSSSSASLTSNRSAKSLPASIRTVEVHRLGAWLRIVELLVESVADRPLPDHRELRVDVDGAGAGDQEEPGLEVLEVVGGERVEPLAVDREHPPGEEAGVEGEQARRIGRRRLDVAPRVADDERVAVEDPDSPSLMGSTVRLRYGWGASFSRVGRETAAGGEPGARCLRRRSTRHGVRQPSH